MEILMVSIGQKMALISIKLALFTVLTFVCSARFKRGVILTASTYFIMKIFQKFHIQLTALLVSIDPGQLINWLSGIVGLLSALGLGRLFWNKRRKKRHDLKEELEIKTQQLALKEAELVAEAADKQRVIDHIEMMTAKIISMNEGQLKGLDKQLAVKTELNNVKIELELMKSKCINNCNE